MPESDPILLQAHLAGPVGSAIGDVRDHRLDRRSERARSDGDDSGNSTHLGTIIGSLLSAGYGTRAREGQSTALQGASDPGLVAIIAEAAVARRDAVLPGKHTFSIKSC